MPKGGKVTYPDATAKPGKAKSDGGSSFGKKSKLNSGNLATPGLKNVGTPRDKGVNR